MALINRLDVVILLSFFYIVFFFVLVDANECSTKCEGGIKTSEGFLKGHSYTYTFDGLSRISLSGAKAQEANANLHAVATVYGLGECSHMLKITHLTYIGENGTKFDGPREITKPVRFSLQNGSIGSELCTEKGDSQVSLNIKRAIISMLQCSKKDNIEVDIFGECLTTTFVDGNIIQKRKNLNECARRVQAEESFLSLFHKAEPTFKSTHIMEANFKIDMKIDSGIVEKADSREEYFFLPFSREKSGAKAVVTSTLRLTDTTLETFRADCFLSKSIIFESQPTKVTTGSEESIYNALLFVTKHLEDHVQRDSPSIFIDLIRVLKSSHKTDILKVFDAIENEKENKNLMRKVFIDALVRTGTGDSILALIELIKRELDPVEKKIILSSFSAVKHVTFDTVKAVTGLLTLPGLPYDVYLNVGAFAGSYCKEYSCPSLSGAEREVIISITDFLVPKLQNCNAGSKENENKIVSALRALKNMNHIEDRALDTLIICAVNKTITPRIRAAALETFTAAPCLNKLKLASFGILEDAEEDSELRIKAYLALLQCPSMKFVTVVQNILDHPNPSMQVGSFITSSLKNILESNDPSREEMRQLFNSIVYKNSFSVDVRKYSQAYETNFDIENMRMKSSIQSNVIYSQNSFMPRSLNMNITTNIFGMDVNLLEIGFRQGNLDRILEEFFGPEGSFWTYTPKTMYNNFRESTYSAYDKIRERMKRFKYRTKRDIRKQITELGTKMTTNIGEYGNSLDIDIFVKLFGTESIYLSLGESPDFSFEALIDRFMNSIDVISGDSDKFISDARFHSLFLDTELTYPTMTGMALKLNVVGASTGKVTFGENCNIRQLFGDAPNTKIEFKLMPSASIQIVGTLSTDADVFVAGLKVATTLHSSTGIDLSAKLSDDGKGFKTDIFFPVQKQELLSATSEIMFFTRKQEGNDVQNKVEFDDNYDYELRCYKDFELCLDSHESLLRAIFGKPTNRNRASLLNGHKKLIVYIPTSKNTAYQFDGTSGINGTTKFWKLMFGTRDNITDNRVVMTLQTDDNELFSISMLFQDPDHTGEYKFDFINTPVEKSFTFTNNYPELQFSHTFKIGVAIDQLGSKTAYRPIIIFRNTDKEFFKTEGVIYLEQSDNKYKYSIDRFGYSTKHSQLHIDGWSLFEPRGLSWFLKITENKRKTYWGNGKVFYNDEEASSNVYIDFENDHYPDINFWFDLSHNTTKDLDGCLHLDVKYVFIYGADRNTETDIITYSLQSTIHNKKEFIYHFKHDLTYPYKKLKHRGEVNYKNGKKINVIFYAEHKHNNIDLVLDLDNSDTNANEKYAALKVVVNKLGGELLLSIKKESEEKTKILSRILVLPNDKYELSMLIETKSIDDNEIVISGHLQFPNVEIYMFEIDLISTPTLIRNHVSVTRTIKKFFDFDAVINFETNLGKMTLDVSGVAIFKGVCKIDPPRQKLIASLNGDLIKFDRVIQLETEITHNQSEYSAEFKIFTDYSKDKSQVYKITTVTLIENSNVKSKNVLFNGDKQTKLNFIIKQIGNINNGRLKFEIELIQPAGVTYMLIYDKEIATYENLSNSTINFVLQKVDVKASNPVKFTTQLKRINYNEKDSLGLISFNATYIRENGDDTIYSFQTLFEDNEGKVTELMTNLSGSMVQNEINLYWWLHSKYLTTNEYKFRANYGKYTSIQGSGSINSARNFPEKYDVNAEIEARLPIENFKTIKIKTKNHAEFNILSKKFNHRILNFSTDAAVNDKRYFYDYKFEISETLFSTSLKLDLPDNDPFGIAFSKNFVSNKEDKNTTTDIEFSASLYGQNVNYTLSDIRLLPLGSGGEFKNVLILPDFIKYKIIKSKCVYNSQSLRKFRFNHDLNIDEKYNFIVDFDIDAASTSMIELISNYPDNIKRRFFLKATDASNEFHAQVIVKNIGDFDLVFFLIGEFKSPMDFNVKIDVNCPKWDMVKCHFEAVNAPSQSGEQELKVTGSENGKIFLHAMTTVMETRDKESVTISGNGKLTWKSVEEPATFKYTQRFNHLGVDMKFDGKVGKKSLHVVHVNTDLNFQLNTKQCDTTSTDCAHFYIAGYNTEKHHKFFNLLWDLKPYGFNTKFNLSADVDDDNETPLTYNFDMSLERNDSYYNWVSNGSFVDDTYKTLTNIKIPSRTFSTETILSSHNASSKCNNESMIGEIIFIWNTSNPDTKTHLKTQMRCSEIRPRQIFNGSFFFIYPGGPREMSMNWESDYDNFRHNTRLSVDLDIFKLKEQEISFSVLFKPHQFTYKYEGSGGYDVILNIDGKGHQVKYDMQHEVRFKKLYDLTFNTTSKLTVENQKNDHRLYLQLDSYKHQELIIEAPVGNLVNFASSFALTDKKLPTGVNWNSSLNFFEDMKYYGEGKFSILNAIHTKLETGIVDPAESMLLEAIYKPRDKAIISNEYKKDGKNYDLFKLGYKRPNNAAAISVNEMNEDQIRLFMKTASKHMKSISKKLTAYSEKNSEMANTVTTRLADILWQSIPDMDLDNFGSELKTIAEEIIGDGVLSLTEVPFQILLTASNALIDNTVNAITKISFLVMDLIEDLSEALNRFLFTSVIETIEWLGTVAEDTFNTYLVHSTEFMTHLSNFINTYAAGWIQIFDEVYIAVCDVVQRSYDWIGRLYEYSEKVKEAAESISDSFLFRYIFVVDMHDLENLLDNMFENNFPDSEFLDLRRLFIEFYEQLNSDEPFDKITKIEELISKAASLISSYVDKMKTGELPNYTNTRYKLKEYTKNLKALAMMTNLPTFLALVYLDENTRLPNFNPADVIPPHQLKGFIASGRHIFSFDGKYLNFPDNCKYVVAQDAVDGNFSIIMNVEQGKPKSVLLYGKEGNIVEVDNSGKLWMNGEISVFPLVNQHVQGYRKGNTFILKSSHGISIKCSKNLRLCYFKISGYYHGKLRGLLGNGNNERFDDFRLPNGEISDSEKDFWKAYSLDCSNENSDHNTNSDMKQTDVHNNASMPALCSDIISNGSLFPYCRLVVDIDPYKMACSETYKMATSSATASHDACLIVETYALSCKANGFPVSVPEICTSCEVDGIDVKASEGEIKFEIPTTQADIVLLIDTAQPNEKIFKTLVTPMVTKIVEELKKSKIDDVKLYLIGFTEKTDNPLYYDLENESLAGNTMIFGDNKKANELTNFLMNLETNSSYINSYMSEYSKQALKNIDRLVSELDIDSVRVAYDTVNDLPLRPNATKSVILVKTTPCTSTFLSNRVHKYIQAVMQDEGIVAHLISPVTFNNTNDNYKDYIGFNNHDVFMLNAKNSLRSGFDYEKDECVDFVLSTSGNVYSTNIFNSMDTKHQEQFVSLTAETVAESMANISYEKFCRCEMGLLEMAPAMRCRTVSRTDNTKSEIIRKFKKSNKNTDATIGRFLLAVL